MVSLVIDMLENKGILICKIKYEYTNFSGINGIAGKYPYIAINSQSTPERQRSTIVHELVHVFFEHSGNSSTEEEKYIEAISGAVLLPASDAFAELGKKRRGISSDMTVVAQEYGISMQLLAKRAKQLEIISYDAYHRFNVLINKAGTRLSEGERISSEAPKLLEQLVLMALSEEKISMSRASELLEIPFYIMREKAEIFKRLSNLNPE